MPSYYSVVQFLPDPIRDEKVNLGVLAYNDSGVLVSHFIRDWKRIRNFADMRWRFSKNSSAN